VTEWLVPSPRITRPWRSKARGIRRPYCHTRRPSRYSASMDLRYNGQDIATVSFSGMFGQRALGGWALRFSLTFRPKQVPQTPHSNFQAEGVYDLRVHVSVSTRACPAVFLGVAHCRQQRFFSITDYGHAEGRLFDLTLLEGQLAALEEMRGADGITFHFDIFAQGNGTCGPLAMEGALAKEFNLSEWTKLLRDMGAAEYLCVPLLLPKPRSGDPHEGAVKHLRRAQDFMLQGEYRSAVGSCREALELLTVVHERAAADGGLLSSAAVLKAYDKTRKQMTRAERLVLLRMAALHLTHLGHHPSERTADVLSRQDASLAVATCAGLISASMADGLEKPFSAASD
jgi:hypothetical protein